MIPFNYLPSGVENDEVMHLCQNLGEQMNTFTQQISYTTAIEEPRKYDDSGMKGKMDEFTLELSKIVGLHELKLQLHKWAKGTLLDEKRRAMGVDLGPRKLPHMAFLGNPGTGTMPRPVASSYVEHTLIRDVVFAGKTTVARILGKLLSSLGVLSSAKVTEVQRTDLVGEFLGQTGPKTRKKVLCDILTALSCC